jgi:hypothetical protein
VGCFGLKCRDGEGNRKVCVFRHWQSHLGDGRDAKAQNHDQHRQMRDDNPLFLRHLKITKHSSQPYSFSFSIGISLHPLMYTRSNLLYICQQTIPHDDPFDKKQKGCPEQ